ncbi:MAG: Fe-S protein assembly chaperone HscA, partial [Polyangiaceae bacterium]
KALASDTDLLSDAERTKVEQAVEDLEQAVQAAKKASSIQLAIDSLEDVTHDWAGRRMDRAIRAATLGKSLGDVEKRVENARGIEAHLEESAAKYAAAQSEAALGGVSVSLEEPKG